MYGVYFSEIVQKKIFFHCKTHGTVVSLLMVKNLLERSPEIILPEEDKQRIFGFGYTQMRVSIVVYMEE